MANQSQIVVRKTLSLLACPGVLLGLGLTAVTIAANLAEAPMKSLCVGLGLLTTAAALTLRFPNPRILFAAALVPFVASLAVDPAWDTVRLVLRLLTGAALAGATLLALPQRVRRLALSLLAVLHFGGIVTAVVSLPPPNGPEPWLARQVGARFYKPYLELTYLTNAYHFYAPEPGPETLLWFHIEYQDGQSRWLKLPDSAKGRSNLADLRVGALAQGVMETLPSTDLPQELIDQRIAAGQRFQPPMPAAEEGLDSEYQEPSRDAKALLQSFACHVAASYPHPTDPKCTAAGIKIYRVVHRLLTPQEFRDGLNPDDPTTYLAYYQGDFEPSGKLKPTCFRLSRTDEGEVEVYQDPLLYWLIPVVRDSEGVLTDYVKLHAESRE